MARAYLVEMRMAWPMLLDPDQVTYRDYGMTRGNWWSLYGPVSIWNYLKLMTGGRKPGKAGKDWRQLGGDVLIDPDSIVRINHVSHTPHDRPAVESILATARPRAGESVRDA